MAKNNNTLLLIGAAVIGYLLYKKETNPEPAPVAVPAAGALVAPVTGTDPVLPHTSAPASAPAVQSSDVFQASSNNSRDAVIISWFATLSPANAKQANAQFANMTSGEKDSLYDLIYNDWQGGQGNTPARTTFWNTWRVKYHVLDGTYK